MTFLFFQLVLDSIEVFIFVKSFHLDQIFRNTTNFDDIQTHALIHTNTSQSHIDFTFRIEVGIRSKSSRNHKAVSGLQRTNQCVQVRSLILPRSYVRNRAAYGFPVMCRLYLASEVITLIIGPSNSKHLPLHK